MDRLRSLEVYVAVIESGSFTAAARALDISAVMVGKYIQELEQGLAAQLIQRTTRQMRVTESGQAFYAEARQVLEQLRRAYESVEGLQSAPSGLLRISAPMTLGSSVVAPLVADFLLACPQVRVELILNNNPVDLLQEGFDAAFRIARLDELDLVARPLQPYAMLICAAPDYLQRHGTPLTPADLGQHRLLVHSTWTQRFNWALKDGSQEFPWPQDWVMKSNDGPALRLAALAGAGVLMQPRFLVEDDLASGALVSLLEEFLPAPKPVHLIYPPQRSRLPKLKAFIDFVSARLGPDADTRHAEQRG
ncbi:LysR family transcriptional regulator [Pseudomonas sp. NPDC090202]|uniref:LysR family transcriptional regulator n=1 Tax=unclassified Pseudomonas TaxID=196821 RepID=UPI00380526B5